ncbi:MAG: tRNA lysidine(34) synthetase TilS [Bacteroidia bacterium]|nr:tRNA lysidine(34) synthetase TilS [Bacteroidia bacterium]
MISEFKNYISGNRLFHHTSKLLLGISGGIDSVVLLHLCYKSGFKFAIAHCNFGLRGAESDADELFVKQLAKKYKVPFYSTLFNTKQFADQKSSSIQMAARELRYNWFEKICKQNKYAYILTAHHKDDELETFFINLIRGTGISGLHGIYPRRGKIIRPLLFATRAEIEKYATQNKLNYREDSSNKSDKYIRNKLRLKIIPVLKEINPSLNRTISSTIARIRQVEQVYKKALETEIKKLLVKKNNTYDVDIVKLAKLQPQQVYIYELLKPFGFNEDVCENLIDMIVKKSTGGQFVSLSHRIIKNRNKLTIVRKEIKSAQEYLVRKDRLFITKPLSLSFEKQKSKSYVLPRSSHIASLDYEKLKFPLTIRCWKPGDFFQPLGMNSRKKLSDFFIDNKFSQLDKENTWLLVSQNEIVWVIGYRINERYKITRNTNEVYVIRLATKLN